MSAWMNETATINPSAVNGNAFTHMNDPSAIMDPSPFMGGANPAQFNHQFTQQQMLAMQQNGQMRNPSPSFPTPMYQTNPVVPSKRPRQDSIASSPRQNPGMLPTSRAETPQQANFPGFQQPQQQQQPPQQGGQPQYPHLQPNGSSNATPSPIMANQLRPGSVPQRVSTASPHPFSPASQQFPQSSPAPSEHGGTPQPNPYMQNNAFQQGFQGAPSPARPSPSPNPMAAQMMQQGMGQMPQQMGQMPNPMMTQQMMQHMQMQQMQQMQQLALQQMQGMPQAQAQAQAQAQQKMLYQRMLQQQLQQQQQGPMQMAAHMQGQMMAQGRSPMPKQPGQMPNGQMPPNAMRPQQQRPQANPEAFIKNLTTFMTTRGKQINPTPLVDGRPIHLMNLFQKVLIHGGYKHVTGSNLWSTIAVALGFPPPQHPMAGQQLKGHYETNLYEFEGAYQANANQKKMPAPPQPGVQMGAPQTPVKQQMPGQAPGPQISPAPAQGPQPPLQTPVKPMPPGAQQVSINGFTTPQLPHAQPQSSNTTPGHTRNSLSRSLEPGTHPDFPAASPAPGQKQPGLSPHGPQAGSTQMAQSTARFPAPFSKDPEEYMPCSREITTVGGVDLNAFAKLGREVELYRPDVPPLDSMGTIDVAALTRSLQCGIHGEIRMALDVLATLTSTVLHVNVQHFALQLEYCDELLEALVDLGEDQVDDLVEDTVEVSDEILITSYEDVVRACRLDKVALRVVHAFGTPEHKLDQAANRLICITTILRNLSFTPENYKCLADEVVIKFICVVIRYLGTHNMLLRTNANTLDLMKDLVILLSNIAHEVELPGREQALCLLQFLLAFAPGPVPTTSHERLFFTPYDPALHPYLPPAVDALAKLLARDQPNRTFYKAIFAVDAQNSAPYELITRTFALAIAPIPDQTKESRQANLQPVTKAREPFLMQGLLAADIVASLAPGHESGLTRGWLSSGNGFAQNLFRLIRILSSQFEGHPQRGGRGMHRNKDDGLVYMVRLGVSMLRKLSEKARDPSDPITSIPPNVVPSRDTVYGALQMQSADWSKEGVLKDIIAYAALED